MSSSLSSCGPVSLPNQHGVRSDYLAPRNSIEARLAKIWGRTLGKYLISIKDNFFDLGGTSLLAIRLLAQIKREFREHLPFATIFEAQTIEEMGTLLRNRLKHSSNPIVHPQIDIDLDHIHIWHADLNDFDSLKSIHCLSKVEQDRASRFAHPKDQEQYRAAHIILRQILNSYQSQPLLGIPFEISRYGKPSLGRNSGSSVTFNMSHSGSAAFVVVGNARSVGIDSEFAPTDIFDDPMLCKLAFNSHELEICASFSIENRKRYLLRLWTFKEAYIKLKGKSLAHHLQEIATPHELLELDSREIHYFKSRSISYWHQTPSDSCPYSTTVLAEGCVNSVRVFDFHEHQRTFPASI